jgi:hypothetical protein
MDTHTPRGTCRESKRERPQPPHDLAKTAFDGPTIYISGIAPSTDSTSWLTLQRVLSSRGSGEWAVGSMDRVSRSLPQGRPCGRFPVRDVELLGESRTEAPCIELTALDSRVCTKPAKRRPDADRVEVAGEATSLSLINSAHNDLRSLQLRRRCHLSSRAIAVTATLKRSNHRTSLEARTRTMREESRHRIVPSAA